MANKVVITSVNAMTTAEGENISYTYSEIDETGNKVITNERRTFILLDDNMIDHVNELKKFIKTKHNTIK